MRDFMLFDQQGRHVGDGANYLHCRAQVYNLAHGAFAYSDRGRIYYCGPTGNDWNSASYATVFGQPFAPAIDTDAADFIFEHLGAMPKDFGKISSPYDTST